MKITQIPHAIYEVYYNNHRADGRHGPIRGARMAPSGANGAIEGPEAWMVDAQGARGIPQRKGPIAFFGCNI